jgi:lactate dehydrogenase-like 2-hydroxyacid dehydrogenase
MRLLYHSRSRRPEAEAEVGATFVSLDELLASSDFVSLHVPGNASTRHMIGAAEIARMKPTAYLINASRGIVVDQAALAQALREGRIAGAGLDVYNPEPVAAEDPIRTAPNCVLMPHVGAASFRTRYLMSELAARNLIAVLRSEAPLACVNPSVLASERAV